MAEKPTYEELEQRVNCLEKKLARCKANTRTDQINLEYLEAILNNTNLPIFLKDVDFNYILMNRKLRHLTNMDTVEIQGKNDFDVFSESVARLFRIQDKKVVKRRIGMDFEETVSLPDKRQYTFMTSKFPLIDDEGRVYAIGGLCTDVTARKKMEADLQKAKETLLEAHDELEQRVARRTVQLDRKTERLMEINVALNVLLEKREKDKHEFEGKIRFDIENLISPYLEKLKAKCNRDSQLNLLDIIQLNIEEISSSFTHEQRDVLTKLTPAQIRIANLIMQGYTTKEIASLVNLSSSTIACHRQEIRKRLSLTNTKVNLQTALLAARNN